MSKLTLKATTEQTTVLEVKLKPQARQMLVTRLDEHAKLAAIVKDAKGTKKAPGRMKRIEEEISEIFRKEKAGKALLAGTALDGHRMKLVTGKTRKFDQAGFMKKHGLGQADFDEFTDYVDNAPYVKLTHGDEGDDE